MTENATDYDSDELASLMRGLIGRSAEIYSIPTEDAGLLCASLIAPGGVLIGTIDCWPDRVKVYDQTGALLFGGAVTPRQRKGIDTALAGLALLTD